ncbi:cell division protein SepF [Candidatus Bathyarchaeota archaeon]|nr:cell division protein SepF [Candidatus Bathyarchaeota archaeon]
MPALEKFHKPEIKDSKKAETTPLQNKNKNPKVYLRAMPLRSLSDLESIKDEVKKGNILILRITPLASKNIEEVKQAVNDLYEFTESRKGDIARLGEERIVICPEKIKIWRDKTPILK